MPQMKAEGADIIVAIPHSGINTTAYSEEAKAENSSWYLADVDGIDAIMFGHSHLTLMGNGDDDVRAFRFHLRHQ